MEAVFHHLCIQTNNYEASVAFYQKLGFVLKEETPNFHGRAYNSWLQLGAMYIELQTGKAPLTQIVDGDQMTGVVHFCLWVPDIEAYLTQCQLPEDCFKTKAGQKIYQVMGGNLCKFIAPEGTVIEIREKRGF